MKKHKEKHARLQNALRAAYQELGDRDREFDEKNTALEKVERRRDRIQENPESVPDAESELQNLRDEVKRLTAGLTACKRRLGIESAQFVPLIDEASQAVFEFFKEAEAAAIKKYSDAFGPAVTDPLMAEQVIKSTTKYLDFARRLRSPYYRAALGDSVNRLGALRELISLMDEIEERYQKNTLADVF